MTTRLWAWNIFLLGTFLGLVRLLPDQVFSEDWFGKTFIFSFLWLFFWIYGIAITSGTKYEILPPENHV